MKYHEIINIIISEPIYLSIAVLLLLSFVYSILKKFFTLLIIILICLIGYVGYLIYTNQDLPGDSDEVIYPFIDSAKEKAGSILEELSD